MTIYDKLEAGYYKNPEPTYIRGEVVNNARKQTAWKAREEQLNAEFKRDLFAEFGVSEHPKANDAFDLAVEFSGGEPEEVTLNVFRKLVKLFS
jgi:hypothetical protein